MMRRSKLLVAAFAAILLTGHLFPAQAQSLERVVDGLAEPVAIAHAGDGSDRLFVVEQRGKIRVVVDGTLLPDPFLDVSDLLRGGTERGLLGLAFHPDYAENGRFFINYTGRGGTSFIAEAQVSDDPNVADRATLTDVLVQEQPFANHNGGQLAFGPDGYLYIALGDGGDGGDPLGSGQDLNSLLGTLLRIDVDSGDPYAVPPDNPFVGVGGALPEIWAYGLRNPWRFSFDRETGDLFIADVGQRREEEINFQPADSAGGENYGWNIREGDGCFLPSENCTDDGLTAPIIAYQHSSGWGRSVTGGYVYRGAAIPDLVGSYVFGDYVSQRVFVAVPTADGWEASELFDAGFGISTFGEDEAGELYIADHQGGVIYRFAP